jgi:SAM-dependent methyltransferase
LLALRRGHAAWRLCGVDASPAMLAVARAKPAAGAIDWRHGALGQVIPGGPYDAVGCFYDTLNHLPDRRALNAAVAAVAAALRPGGLFVFDVTNELGFRRWWRGDSVWRGEGWTVATRTSYDPATGLAHAEVTVEQGAARTACQLGERCFAEEEIHAALGAAGLHVVASDRWSPFEIDASGKTWVVSLKSNS